MEEYGNLWSILSYILTSGGSAALGWFFTRKKYNEEVESTRVQNFDAAIEAYKKMYEDMIEDLKTQNGELKEEVEGLKKELSENRKQIVTLTNFVLRTALQQGEVAGNFDDLKEIIK